MGLVPGLVGAMPIRQPGFVKLFQPYVGERTIRHRGARNRNNPSSRRRTACTRPGGIGWEEQDIQPQLPEVHHARHTDPRTAGHPRRRLPGPGTARRHRRAGQGHRRLRVRIRPVAVPRGQRDPEAAAHRPRIHRRRHRSRGQGGHAEGRGLRGCPLGQQLRELPAVPQRRPSGLRAPGRLGRERRKRAAGGRRPGRGGARSQRRWHPGAGPRRHGARTRRWPSRCSRSRT